MTFKVGVLSPQSNFLPHLSKDLPTAVALGLKLFIDEEKVEIIPNFGGFNAEAPALIEKVNHLILQESVDIVIAALNPHMIEHIQSVCSIEQVPLIVLSMQENLFSEDNMAEGTFINSFDLWKSSWLTAYTAANENNHKIASMNCIHDGGYNFPFAMALGTEAANSEVVHTAITHRDSRDQCSKEEINDVLLSSPNAIIANYSSKEAISFFNDYKQLSPEAKLYALPMATDEIILDQLATETEGIKTVSSWSKEGDEHVKFATDFSKATGREVNPYLLLAYEAANLIAKALDHCSFEKNYEQLCEALDQASFVGPRGEMSFNMDKKGQRLLHYLIEVKKDQDDKLYRESIRPLHTPELLYEQQELAQKQSVPQGWRNPYLIA